MEITGAKFRQKKWLTSPEDSLLMGNVFPHFVPRRDMQWPAGHSLS